MLDAPEPSLFPKPAAALVMTPQPEDFTQFSKIVRRLTIAFEKTTQRSRATTSIAARDLADTSLDGRWGEVGAEVAYRYAPWAFLASDHLRATASLIRAEHVVAATLTTARAAMENLALLHWFHDPEIDFHERVRRHANLRFLRATETRNLLAGHPDTASQQIIDEVTASAPLLGLPVSRPRQPWKPPTLGEGVPGPMELVKGIFSDQMEDGSRYGAMIYRLYSAGAHGADHTIPNWVLSTADTEDDRVSRASFGVSLPQLALWLSPLLHASNVALERMGHYQGWDLTYWERVYPEVLGRFGEISRELR